MTDLFHRFARQTPVTLSPPPLRVHMTASLLAAACVLRQFNANTLEMQVLIDAVVAATPDGNQTPSLG